MIIDIFMRHIMYIRVWRNVNERVINIVCAFGLLILYNIEINARIVDALSKEVTEINL